MSLDKKAGKYVRKITSPDSFEGIIDRVKDDPVIAKYLEDEKVVNKIDEIVDQNYKKYEKVLDGYAPTAAQIGGTAGGLGADLLYVLSGGLGGMIKLYTVGAKAVMEAPTMMKIAYNEGAYHGTIDTLKFFAKKALSFFLPGGSVIDLGSVKNYARDAIVRESRNEMRKYLKQDYVQEQEAEESKILRMEDALKRTQLDKFKEAARAKDQQFYAAAGKDQEYKLVA